MARRESTTVGVLTTVVVTFLAYTPIASAQEGCGAWTLYESPPGVRAVTKVEARSADDAWAIAALNPNPARPIRWDGAAWSLFSIDGVCSGYGAIVVDAIGLLDPSYLFVACFGNTGPFSSDQLLLIWDGTSWDNCHSVTLQPNLAGAPRNGATNAVVGASLDDVWMLGRASGLGDGVTGEVILTLHWDGTELTEIITPGYGNRQNEVDDAVLFASDDIWAAGYFQNNAGPNPGFHAAIYHWDGTSWSFVPTPAEFLDTTILHAIDGVAPDDIWVAGEYNNDPLFMHWDGSSWSIVPSPPTFGIVYELVAIASDDVWAVDFVGPGGIGKFYHWDGVSWSIVPPQEIPGAIEVKRHGGLAAVGECDLWATGSIDYGSGVEPFIERLRPGSVATTGEPGIGQLHSLLEVAPNPLRRATSIRLTTPGDEIRVAHIYDVGGSLIRTLANGTAASGEVSWDGRDDAGSPVRGGVYFVRVESTEGVVQTRMLTVVQ